MSPGADPLAVTVAWARPDPADAAVLDLLAGTERERADRFRRPADRDRFLTAQALLRRTLTAVTGEVASDLVRRCPGCASTRHGPLALAGRDDVSLSVSHSGSRVVVAVVAGAGTVAPSVGVDVEEVGERATTLDVAPTVLAPAELAAHRGAADPRGDLITRWSRKEAVLKATRQGLTVPMSDVVVSDPGEPAALVAWTGAHRPAAASAVTLADLAAGAGYRAAVAVLTARPLLVRV